MNVFSNIYYRLVGIANNYYNIEFWHVCVVMLNECILQKITWMHTYIECSCDNHLYLCRPVYYVQSMYKLEYTVGLMTYLIMKFFQWSHRKKIYWTHNTWFLLYLHYITNMFVSEDIFWNQLMVFSILKRLFLSVNSFNRSIVRKAMWD